MKVLELNLNQYDRDINDHDVKEAGQLAEREPRFFRRQFQPEATPRQRKFDWIFGVVLPAICFALDPAIFRGGLFKGAFLGSYRPFTYLLTFTAIFILVGWMLYGQKFRILNVFASGLFLIGGITSLCIGIVLAPLSAIGLLFLIGALGFVPFLTSFVYLRNSVRAFGLAKPFLNKSALAGAFALSAALSFTIPLVVNADIYQILEAMRNGDPPEIAEGANKLQYFGPLVNADRLAGKYCSYAYGSEKEAALEAENRKALSEAYQKLTGHSMERIDKAICYDW